MAATDGPSGKLRVAAIGDLHVMEDSVTPYREMFAEIANAADVLVLCGDLTNFGKTSEAEILAEDIRACSIPVLGVLGNHDYECGQPEQVCSILQEAGMTVLDEQAVEIEGVGFAGVKGFLGGFGRGELAPFGEPIVKAFVDEVLSEARKLENQLRTLRTERSVAVLHYSPIIGTIEGEPPEIFQYLGSQRLCEPIDRFDHVQAVVHGHAHHGTYEGRTPMGKPVYNVAQFVLRPLFGKAYTVLEI
ncbi:metallophosphoesterase family protein [Sphingomonas segetis]|jgi:Icc-related predicted phosphoesterase|uniref:metallophosphoesterase family protein n=1 Tax=Sphingomonas segetis TaxID=1104779 RepID=UPI0012D2F099|nr:metallophosphoesterase [Sphingomonas segetis]